MSRIIRVCGRPIQAGEINWAATAVAGGKFYERPDVTQLPGSYFGAPNDKKWKREKRNRVYVRHWLSSSLAYMKTTRDYVRKTLIEKGGANKTVKPPFYISSGTALEEGRRETKAEQAGNPITQAVSRRCWRSDVAERALDNVARDRAGRSAAIRKNGSLSLRRINKLTASYFYRATASSRKLSGHQSSCYESKLQRSWSLSMKPL